MIESNLVDQIYHLLKEKIVNHEVKMGQRLYLDELAQEFNVSQTPVREVINRLMKDGLITNIPRRGYFVIELESRDLDEIYDLRKMIECYALESGIEKIEPGRIQALLHATKSLQESLGNTERGNPFYSLDIELHLLIVNNSPNKRLHEIYSQISNVIKIILTSLDKRQYEGSVDAHIQILEAMLEKDLPKTIKLLKEHLDIARDQVKLLKIR